jgi:cytochrome c oxidase cbb3-type subunit 4
MDINDLRSLVTVISFLTFLGIVFWAYGVKSNKARFAEAAQLPFTEDGGPDAVPGGFATREQKGK